MVGKVVEYDKLNEEIISLNIFQITSWGLRENIQFELKIE